MEWARGSRAKDQSRIKPCHGRIGFDSNTILVIRLPDQRMLRVLSRSVFLAMVLLTLPFIGSIWRKFSLDSHSELSSFRFGSDLIDAEFLDVLLQDLASEGLIKNGNKALIVTSGAGDIIGNSQSLNAYVVDFVLESDLVQESLFPHGTFDFVLSLALEDARSVDRIVRVGGIVVFQLDHPNSLQRKPNYKVVYLHRYVSTIVAMRKTSLLDQHQQAESSAKRKLLQLELVAKTAVLERLEHVLPEPPKKVLSKSRQLFKRFNYLPDLLGDSPENFPRRVFVHVGLQEGKNGAMAWFKGNHPTINQEFELYNIGAESTDAMPRVDAPNWLIKNAREDDFVVMKAGAEVVEEMMKRKSIRLVDELFLECKNQWQNWNRKNIKRAYWECMALYGRLRDEGVAVHQWWGEGRDGA